MTQPSLFPMYATINKLRLFAKPGTIGAAEAVLERIVETYELPLSALEARNSHVAAHDILRTFAECLPGGAEGPALTSKESFHADHNSSTPRPPAGQPCTSKLLFSGQVLRELIADECVTVLLESTVTDVMRA